MFQLATLTTWSKLEREGGTNVVHKNCFQTLFYWGSFQFTMTQTHDTQVNAHLSVIKDYFYLQMHITPWCLILISLENLSSLQTRKIPVWTQYLQAHSGNTLGLEGPAHVLCETFNCVSGLQSESGEEFSQNPVPKTWIYLPIPDSRAETKNLPW